MQISLRPNINEVHKLNCNSPSIKERCNEIIIVKENILDIYIAELKFTHHPLFSVEHVLVEKLCSFYDEYTEYIKNNNTDRIKTQLEALRYLRRNIENRKEIDECTLKRAVKVNRDIQKLRKTYFEEGKRERENLKNILNTWKQIKRIRGKQNFSNTNIKLLIKKEKVDYEVDCLKYNKEFDETLREIIKEIKIEQQEIEENKIKSINENLENLHKNRNFDTNENIREDLQRLFQQSFREPGEPILTLLLSGTHEITNELKDSKEVTRRNAMKSTKIYLNIMCDKVQVCKSKPLDLNDSFLLDLKETFSIQLRETPKHLNIEVIEQQKGLVKKKLCEIIVTVPLQTFSPRNNKLVKASFEANEIVHYKHAGIGSGTDLKEVLESFNLTHLDGNHNLITTGFIKYCISWQKTLQKKYVLYEQIELLKNITNKNLAMNVNKLSEWMSQSIPDPQDPRNIVFFEYMAGCDSKFLQNNNFR